ncbi:MAG: hypothetical protein NTW86_19485 [Candidatus Sumerlaeota bacterium]|nr:hypothetical protein [Candidatus Sumerlaeota bacterium]
MNHTTCLLPAILAGVVGFAFGATASLPESQPAAAPGLPRDCVIFSINVHDFAYLDLSAAALNKILDIHEKHRVPVDFYLTTTMTDLYEAKAPQLLQRLKTSPVASVSYHVRPPSPYYVGYDWLGLGQIDAQAQYETIMRYETHGLDPVTGQPTDQPGGYKKLADLMGYDPCAASAQAEVALASVAAAVFKDLGARLLVEHGHAINFGDKRGDMFLRPELVDLKLYEHLGTAPSAILQEAFEQAHRIPTARAPYFVGVKMHDNNFFARDAAWTAVYMQGPRRPPWDLDRKAPLVPEARQAAMWDLYESTVAYVASHKESIRAVSAPMVVQMLNSRSDARAPRLYVSGTMHIETNPGSWPNPDRLLAFFERATKAGRVAGRDTGMRWSIGADIGWLEGEPRAGEIIRATEAMGVEWDVHAHKMQDRPRCAAAIRRLGGHPNAVASGLIATELGELRSPIQSSDGSSWQAEVVWGIVRRPGHGPGADDNAAGLWRPKSAEEFTVDDPAGHLVAVGGGSRRLEEAEKLAKDLAAGDVDRPPVISATIMVSPRLLAIVGTEDGIEAIEAWANRVGAMPVAQWATIRETAKAWLAAGAIPSRMDIETASPTVAGPKPPLGLGKAPFPKPPLPGARGRAGAE